MKKRVIAELMLGITLAAVPMIGGNVYSTVKKKTITTKKQQVKTKTNVQNSFSFKNMFTSKDFKVQKYYDIKDWQSYLNNPYFKNEPLLAYVNIDKRNLSILIESYSYAGISAVDFCNALGIKNFKLNYSEKDSEEKQEEIFYNDFIKVVNKTLKAKSIKPDLKKIQQIRKANTNVLYFISINKDKTFKVTKKADGTNIFSYKGKNYSADKSIVVLEDKDEGFTDYSTPDGIYTLQVIY